MSATTPRTRSRWFAPSLQSYRGRWVLRDLFAGIAAGAVVIPQAMAYATIAGLPIEVGLFTCMVPMVVYALLGGSRAMSVSTTSTVAALTATTLVAAGVAADSDDVVGDLATLTLLVGAILVVVRVFRLGRLADYVGYSSLTGLEFAVGATVIVGQVPRLVGVEVNVTGHGFLPSVAAAVEAVPDARLPPVLVSLGVFVVIAFLARIAPRFPGLLVAVVGSILLMAYWFNPIRLGIPLVDRVPTDAIRVSLPGFDDVVRLLPGALAIATLAFVESVIVARVIRRGGEHQIDGNREVFAIGAAGVAGAFFGAMPPAGGFSQSAVNRRAGARSQLAGAVTAVLAVLVVVFLAPWLAFLPEATLAAIVIFAVLPLVDPRSLVRLARISRLEFWVAAVTALVGLVAGLLWAVAVGVVLAVVLVLRERVRPITKVVRSTPQELVVRVETPLLTGNVVETIRLIDQEADAAGRPGIVVVELPVQRRFSVMVLDTLAEYEVALHDGGAALWIVGLRDVARETARKTEWFRRMVEEGRAPPSIDG